jgi:hypothetical protein
MTATTKHGLRKERRAKQRAGNLLRAQKMHASRLAQKSQPPQKFTKETPVFNVGCSGWFYWDWRGQFYPEDLPASQWFGHYASHLKQWS